MRTDLFDFELPRELIADRPADPRDSSRMLVVRDPLEDRTARDLPEILSPGDVIVVNDTKVIPAQLHGFRRNAAIGLTLHRRLDLTRWRAFARPARKLRDGDVIEFADDFRATLVDKFDGGEVEIAFEGVDDPMVGIHRYGEVPLPPYIARPSGPRDDDTADYQTIYAARDGAVAAPTAGLHFTDDLFARLDNAGIGRVTLTLHVGAGTFLPVKADDTDDHKMHTEWGELSEDAAARLNAARDSGGRIVSVGTTSLRLMESAADADGRFAPFSGETDLFITPGYAFKSADVLMTNFHLPKSTLFMLVSAFSGLERMKTAYEHAKAARYRFYSYGDATLLFRADAA